MIPFETAPYRVSRTDLAQMGAKEYIRNFWWFVAAVPLFGLIGVIFGQGLMQVVGMFALLWPFSIPARSVMSTSKSSRLFSGGCRMRAHEDYLEFLGETPGKSGRPYRMVIPAEQIRDVVQRGEWVLIRTIKLGFAPVPASAFPSPSTIEELRKLSLASASAGP